MKVEELNDKIKRSIGNAEESEIISMINLSALASVCLRKNDLNKLKDIEEEIDEALRINN